MVSPSLFAVEERERFGCTVQAVQPISKTKRPDSVASSARNSSDFRPISPSLIDFSEEPITSACESPSLLTINSSESKRSEELKRKRSQFMTISTCKRVSRMARPAEPSSSLISVMNDTIEATLTDLYSAGLALLQPVETRVFSVPAASGGKGPSVRVNTGDVGLDETAQQKAHHMMSIHGRSLENDTGEPSWLLDTTSSCPKAYGRLAASAIRSNAVNSSVTNREKTQGAANQVSFFSSQSGHYRCTFSCSLCDWTLTNYKVSRFSCFLSQTSRINCKVVTQAASAQAVVVAASMALGRAFAKKYSDGVFKISNPMATYAPSVSEILDPSVISHEDGHFPVVMSSKLLFNSCPTKLSDTCVVTVAKALAMQELDVCLISERMTSSKPILDGVCKAICFPGKYDLDSIWASWVLIVYLTSHPEGRAILRGTKLTDVDYQTASTFEAYGRAEITRRARLEAQQELALKKRKSVNSSQPRASSEPRFDGPREEGVDFELLIQKRFGTEGSSNSSGAIDSILEKEKRQLAKKRKRSSKGSSAASAYDGLSMLSWWAGALRCENSSVLTSLIASSKQAAKKAAAATLERQVNGDTAVSENLIIKSISEQNAVTSAQALIPFVGRRKEETPRIMAWLVNGQEYRGTSRTKEDARATSIHACITAPQEFQPAKQTVRLVWSESCMHFAPRSEEHTTLPSILEKMKYCDTLRMNGKMSKIRADRLENNLIGEVDNPRPSEISGITRSTIGFVINMKMDASLLKSGLAFGEEIIGMRIDEDSKRAAKSSPSMNFTPQLIGSSQSMERRIEPLCSPVNRLAIGIEVSEEIRVWFSGKTRKNNPCKVVLGISRASDRIKDCPSLLHSEPPPLLTLVDFSTEVHDDEPPVEQMQAGREVEFNTLLHVCGDKAVRLPEVLKALNTHLEPDKFVDQARALIWAATSQASFISDIGTKLSAGHSNSSIASSKKISVSDNHRLLLLTVFDVYAAGLANLEPTFWGTSYQGCYGPTFDSGVSSPGLLCHNLSSDKRQHGSLMLSQKMANKLGPIYAQSHYVKCEDGVHFVESPIGTRGVPHCLTPGVHMCLETYRTALETFRLVSGNSSCTQDTLLCLPVGPWTQALPPVVESTADSSMRMCVRDPSTTSIADGRAYLPDVTSDEFALVREPLFRRPSMHSSIENPFSTIYESVESFFGCVNAVVMFGRVLAMLDSKSPPNQADSLFDTINKFVNEGTHSPQVPLVKSRICADVLLLLNIMYPLSYKIGENAILESISKLPGLVYHKNKSLPYFGLQAEEVQQLRTFWSAFHCVWKNGPLGKLLSALDEHDGNMNVTSQTCEKVRHLLEDSAQACLHVHSAFGDITAKHPLYGIKETRRVRGTHLNGVFVSDVERGVEQRGGLIGCKPHQLRQVCSLAMGVDVKGVVCQFCRNEGEDFLLEHLRHPTPYSLLPTPYSNHMHPDAQAVYLSEYPPRQTSSMIKETRGAPSLFRRCVYGHEHFIYTLCGLQFLCLHSYCYVACIVFVLVCFQVQTEGVSLRLIVLMRVTCHSRPFCCAPPDRSRRAILWLS